MRHVEKQLRFSIQADSGPVLGKLDPAVIAVPCSQVIFPLAILAPIRHLSARHGHKWTRRSLDDFHVVDNESVFQAYRTVGQELRLAFRQFYSDFGDFHYTLNHLPHSPPPFGFAASIFLPATNSSHVALPEITIRRKRS